jgi:hypothetical protein
MEEVFLKCAVANGIFTDEREVTIDTREGEKITFLTNKAFVQSPSVGEKPVEGKLKVVVVKQANDEALIRLPSQSSPAANNIWVMRWDIER